MIAGGESGPGARPCDLRWIRSIVEQCRAASVPCFVKQVGSNPYLQIVVPGGLRPGGVRSSSMGKGKGGDPAGWPEDLRVRQVPA